MAWVRLSNWMGGHAPGEVVEVADGDVKGLIRDGRVADVLPSRRDGGDGPEVPDSAPAEPVADTPALSKGRRKADE